MPLESGARLGPYEIEEAIGAGGMGEVYRARDTRLERLVAIKVLPAHLAENPELRQRLEREAKAISSLSHPNICPLYDIGHENGVDYLVMELIEGETLGERLVKGPLSLEQTLKIGIQIADALEKAHRQGIVHRDLKPGNVMLTASGAKLLDFGLAKADTASGPGDELTRTPTVSQPLTTAGTVIGTYQYMAPEQLEGKEVDPRTDIFALGAVLYEMATGRRAFLGATQASLIGAIMHERPQPVSALQPMTPPAFDRVIQTCLAKDAEERWQTAHDVKLQLEWIAEGGSVVGLPAPVAARRKSRERLAWIVAAAAAAGAGVLLAGFLSRAPAKPVQTRFQIPPPPELTSVDSPRVSPDGRYLAYRGVDSAGKAHIWLRPLDSLEARPIAGTEGARSDRRPMWSPDSRHIAFFVGDKLKKVAVAGGPAQTICDADGADGTWGSTGEILFDGAISAPLMRVSAAGGIARPEIAIDELEDVVSVGWPEFLPDGKHFLYLAETTDGTNRIMVRTLDKGEERYLGDTDSRVQYAPPGYLIHVLDGMLVARPFDAGKAEVTGEPVPLADNVGATAVGLADFSASGDGTLAFRGGDIGGRQLLWRDREGRELESVSAGLEFQEFWLSPDEKHLVSSIIDQEASNVDLWIRDLERGVTSRFTFDAGVDTSPVWSPDGTKIVFSSNRGEHMDLYIKEASGAGTEELLLSAGEDVFASDWSSDGRFIAFYQRSAENGWDVSVLPMDGSNEPIPVLQSQFAEVRPRFSRDGRWIAYNSNESGEFEIYVRQFPGPGGQWQVSTNGGVEPVWSADGKEVFYLDSNRAVVSVPVEVGETFRAGLPTILFDGRLYPVTQRGRYGVTRDGQRFLTLSPMTGASIPPVTVVLNWNAELEG
jgi:Tol biopolymer transport system component